MEITQPDHQTLKNLLLEYASLDDEEFRLNNALSTLKRRKEEIRSKIHPIAICSEAYVQLEGQIALIKGDEDDITIEFIKPIVIVESD